MKKQKKYEYVLPEDITRLSIDAIVYAGLDAIHDGPTLMSREVVEEKARRICEQFKTATKAQYVSNDFDAFKQIVLGNYVIMYFEKQKIYKNDITAHQKEVELAKKYGDQFKVYYCMFVEKTTFDVQGKV